MASLLIYVPTWKRPELLRSQLDALQSQITAYPQIRVLVSDNDSSNPKMDEIKAWCESRTQFAYRRHPSNIGGNANIALGFVDRGEADLLWILADDTTILPGAIDKIMMVSDRKFDILAFSREETAPESTRFLIEQQGIERVLANYPWGLISNVIFNTSSIEKSIDAAFSFYNSSFPHLGVLFDAANKKRSLEVQWLREADILAEGQPPYVLYKREEMYVQSLTGLPQLFQLAPRWERGRLVRGWTWRYGGAFFRSRKAQPANFLLTRGILLQYGGPLERVALFAGWMEWTLSRTRVGSNLREKLRSNPSMLRFLKRD